jgi:hypothetical protein
MAGRKKKGPGEKWEGKKAPKKKKKETTDQVNWPLGEGFIPSMKSQNVTSAKKLTLQP